MEDTHVIKYTILIRKIAARHQSGENLWMIKNEVDAVIRNFHKTLGGDRIYNVTVWSTLLRALEIHITNMADPRWLEVINYARYRIKSRRSTLAATKKVSGLGYPTGLKIK